MNAPENQLKLSFLPIDFERERHLCISIRRDSYLISFGSTDLFDEGGEERYLEWLIDGAHELPGSMVHVWMQGGEAKRPTVAGQLEMSRKKIPGGGYVGHINLIYVLPHLRRRGIGRRMEEYALLFLSERGCQEVSLNVSPSNAPALAFYKTQGWEIGGPAPGARDCIRCSKR